MELGKRSNLCPDCNRPIPPGSHCSYCQTIDDDFVKVGRSAQNPVETLPERIGEFEVRSVIGRGGMGVVYRAHQPSMQRDVALKVLEDQLGLSRSGRSRFVREAWIAGRLKHANIVRVFSRGEDGGLLYYAMELIDGDSLNHEIVTARAAVRESAVPTSSVSDTMREYVNLFIGVADALVTVHSQDVLHRDIKPLNLLLTKDRSKLLLTDFGLAREEGGENLTRRGDFLGTVRYMSPEQLLASRATLDHRSDIYSFGVTMYETLTLELPHDADSEEAYLSAAVAKDAVPPRRRLKAMPRDLETVLLKCLDRDPDCRYESAAELRDDLQRWVDAMPVLAKPPTPASVLVKWVRRHRSPILVVTSILVLGSLMLWAVWDRQEAGREDGRIVDLLSSMIESGAVPEVFRYPSAELGRLQRLISKDTEGEFASLALRAAVFLRADVLPPHGLVSDPLQLSVVSISTLDLGRDIVSISTIEVSWDEGPWNPVLRCLAGAKSGVGIPQLLVNAGTRSLHEMIDTTLLVEGPHTLHVRARIQRWYEELTPEFYSALPRVQSGARFDRWYSSGDSIPVGLPETGVETELCSLGDFRVSLFEDYPESFPRRIDERTSPEDLLQLISVRIIEVRLPAGGAGEYSFSHRSCELRGTAPARSGFFSAGFEVEWAAGRSATALAGTFRILHPFTGDPMLVTDAVYDDTGFQIFGAPSACGMVILSEASDSVAILSHFATLVSIDSLDDPLAFRGETLSEGVYETEIVYEPSRDVAVEAGPLDSYYTIPFRAPVRLEVVMVDGAWLGK